MIYHDEIRTQVALARQALEEGDEAGARVVLDSLLTQLPTVEQTEVAGAVGVDSGLLLIGDPCYIDKGFDYKRLVDEVYAGGVMAPARDLEFLPDPEQRPGGNTVVFPPGLGDGLYEVDVIREDLSGWGNRVVAVVIRCMEREEIEEINAAEYPEESEEDKRIAGMVFGRMAMTSEQSQLFQREWFQSFPAEQREASLKSAKTTMSPEEYAKFREIVGEPPEGEG